MTVMTDQHPEAISFDGVQIGDVLEFLTADNGFSGSGDPIARTGIVTAKTDKTITLKVGEGTPEFYLNSRGKGATRMAGAHARIRRDDWSARDPRLARRADRAEHFGT